MENKELASFAQKFLAMMKAHILTRLTLSLTSNVRMRNSDNGCNSSANKFAAPILTNNIAIVDVAILSQHVYFRCKM